MIRKGKFKQLLPVLLPILLPIALLLVYLVKESFGQLNNPVQILASIDPSGNGTAYLSTILPDGAEAVWTCSSGQFTTTQSDVGYGRSVTWQATPGYIDSVTVVVVTPTTSDSIRFLPVILEVTPTITVSSAYHVAVLERSRSLALPAGSYSVIVENDNLVNYDGLTILIGHFPGNVRDAWVLFPTDTITIDLPLGAEFEAVALDKLEDAIDNSGSIFIRFIVDENTLNQQHLQITDPVEMQEIEDETEELVEDTLIVTTVSDSVFIDSLAIHEQNDPEPEIVVELESNPEPETVVELESNPEPETVVEPNAETHADADTSSSITTPPESLE